MTSQAFLWMIHANNDPFSYIFNIPWVFIDQDSEVAKTEHSMSTITNDSQRRLITLVAQWAVDVTLKRHRFRFERRRGRELSMPICNLLDMGAHCHIWEPQMIWLLITIRCWILNLPFELDKPLSIIKGTLGFDSNWISAESSDLRYLFLRPSSWDSGVFDSVGVARSSDELMMFSTPSRMGL